jgi:hypothetical protein
MEPDPHLVWYVAYGSNLATERLRCYLVGGRPVGGFRTYAGARNPDEPRLTRSLAMPGGLLFAGSSRTWGGGMAFYDPRAPGHLSARAYLLDRTQVSDVVAQEIRRAPGSDLELVAAREGGHHTLPGSAYDLVLRLEDLDGYPAVTITSSRPGEPNPPASAYLGWICRGLFEAFGWTPQQACSYLLPFPGVQGFWSADELLEVAHGAEHVELG